MANPYKDGQRIMGCGVRFLKHKNKGNQRNPQLYSNLLYQGVIEFLHLKLKTHSP